MVKRKMSTFSFYLQAPCVARILNLGFFEDKRSENKAILIKHDVLPRHGSLLPTHGKMQP